MIRQTVGRERGGTMAVAITVGDHEIEAGCLVEDGAFRATVTLRAKSAVGPVRSVGYTFAQPFRSEIEATAAAKRFALLISLHPERHLRFADAEFAVQ